MTVVFRNSGLIPMEAFTSFGVNAKVSDNPIGEFGTGLKLATAVILRLGGTIRVYRDGVEYEFYTKRKEFRGKEFDWCMMRQRRLPQRWVSKQLPFTTELGQKWEPWQAVREIEANCRDENGESYALGTDGPLQFLPDSADTMIAVTCPEFEEAYHNLDYIFLSTEDRRLLHSSPSLEIWSGRSDCIFYRGLRVTELREPSKMTYNFLTGVDLTEDRTSKYPYLDGVRIRAQVERCEIREIYETILGIGEHEKVYERSLDWDEGTFLTEHPMLGMLRGRISRGQYVLPRLSSLAERYSGQSTKLRLTDDVDVTATVEQWLSLLEGADELHDDVRMALSEAGWEFEDE